MRGIVKISFTWIMTVGFVLCGIAPASATTMEKMNVARLIEHAELILVGRVVSISDGFGANGFPYTEITLEVGEAIRGNTGGTYTFRQFGLARPRDLPDGRTYVGVSPDGWPKFHVGEEVLVFLHARTALDFQSAAGLFQGKFSIENQQVFNELDNLGLFSGVSVDQALLSEKEKKMFRMGRGRFPAETFKTFVRKAVEQDWFTAGGTSSGDRRGWKEQEGER